MNRLILCSLAIPVLAFAQTGGAPLSTSATDGTSMPNQSGIWRAKLPGGVYEVSVRSIVAISSHEYLVDGAARVTEVNIDTAGTLLARFYYLEPHTAREADAPEDSAKKPREGTAPAGEQKQGNAWKRVIKNHPATTHARTVEYRLDSKRQLMALFESVSTAFRTAKGADFQLE